MPIVNLKKERKREIRKKGWKFSRKTINAIMFYYAIIFCFAIWSSIVATMITGNADFIQACFSLFGGLVLWTVYIMIFIALLRYRKYKKLNRGKKQNENR